MKHQQKLLNIFLLLFCFGVIIVSCSLEDEVIHNHYQKNVIPFQKEHLKDLLTNKRFVNNFTNLKKAKYKTKSNDNNRSSIEEAFNFTIVDSIVKVMSDNKNTYYTILIRTDNNTDNKLENLVLLEATDTETIGYIVKYNTLVTEDKKEQEIINSGFSEVIPITIQSNESSNRVMVITYTYSLCNGVPYNCGGSICGFATGIMTIEVDDPGDMTPNSGGWNTDGGGGANTGPGDPNDPTGPGTGCRGCGDIITSPVFEFEDDEETPCEKIKNLTNASNYKTKFKALTNNYDAATETGFSLVGNNYVNGTAVGSNSISVSTNSKNMTHVHNNKPKFYENTTIPYDGAIKILSTADITNVLIPMQSNNTSPTDTFVTMLSDEGIYSISILEPITWNDDIAIKFEIFDAEYRKFSKYIVDNYTTMSEDDRKDYLEKKLLLVLKEIGLENKIGLFEGEIENVNSSDINNYNIKWTRKKLKKVFLGHQVDSEPCV